MKFTSMFFTAVTRKERCLRRLKLLFHKGVLLATRNILERSSKIPQR